MYGNFPASVRQLSFQYTTTYLVMYDNLLTEVGRASHSNTTSQSLVMTPMSVVETEAGLTMARSRKVGGMAPMPRH